MNLIRNAVENLRGKVEHTGCEDGNIVLGVNPDTVICQFERGACMEAVFGGRIAEFVTSEPVSVTTRLGFMFGALFEKPAQRAAACAILNVIAGFLCLSRIQKACPKECHAPCREALKKEIGGRPVFFLEVAAGPGRDLGFQVKTPEEAEVILVTGEGLVVPGGQEIAGNPGGRRVIFLSPSTAGICSLEGLEHWCPYGRA